MKESKKKFSLLANLDNIVSNNFVNTKVFIYDFYSINTLIINAIEYNVSGKFVKIILYLDELIIEIYNDDDICQTFTLPYTLVDELYILLEDKKW